MSLEPPPVGRFPSKDALVESCQAYALPRGYAISTLRSDLKRGWIKLKCDRGGEYQNKRNLTDEERKRVTGSRLDGCPFLLVGHRSRVDEHWYLSVEVSEHNHGLSNDRTAHPSQRRLDMAGMDELASLSRADVPARMIKSILRHNGHHVVSRDVYNGRQKIRAETLDGKTPIQALVEHLGAGEYT